uniref:Uncharacterized protein n=1 Tax=Arundo donax TaxID=35708 RepID=A0A0A8YAH3_ARUDO
MYRSTSSWRGYLRGSTESGPAAKGKSRKPITSRGRFVRRDA